MLNIECENLEVPAERERELEYCVRKGECECECTVV